jgi:hypothetical protein
VYKTVFKQCGFILISLGIGSLFNRANAQITLIGQLRPRTEFRNGFGTLKPLNTKPSAFVSQRTRLMFNYRSSRVVFQTTIQDVRLWGQDASTISVNDGNRLGVHEAWAKSSWQTEKTPPLKPTCSTTSR